MQLNRATDSEIIEVTTKIARIGTWKFKTKERLVQWSDEVYEIHDEYLGKDISMNDAIKYYHENYRSIVKRSIKEAKELKKPWDFEAIIVSAKQREIWVRSLGYPIFNDNELIEIRGAFMDIDKFKRNESKLENYETLFEQIFDNAQVLICLYEPNGRVQKISNAIHTLLGYDVSEVIGMDRFSLVHPNDVKHIKMESNHQLNLQNRKSTTIEYRMQHKEGHYLWFITTTSFLKNDTSEISGILTTSIEITNRRVLEDRISALNAELSYELKKNSKSLQNATIQLNQQVAALDKSALVSIVNRDLEFVFVNELFIQVTGFDFDQIKGKPISYLKLNSDADNEIHDKWKQLSQGNSWTGEIRYRKSDNSTLWMKSTISPFKDAAGNIVKYVCIDFDITESKRMSEELKLRANELIEIQSDLAESLEKEKELSKLKSSFVATASHQFRTPLTVIQSSMSILQMQLAQMDLDPMVMGKVNAVYDRVQTQVRKMTEMMNEVLILGKIENNGIKAKPKKLDVKFFLEDLIYKLNMIEDERVVLLKTFGKPKELNLDVHLFEHALINVLTNALKYSKGRPDPIVELDYTAQSQVEIRVKDFGVGIPGNEIDKVFESFYRASNVEEISGTGLGMAIVKQYVMLNNGTVQIHSELGTGTTVIIKF